MSLANRLSVTVSAPARLHLGFLDLNGSLGRRFGSLGLALEEPCVRVAVSPCERIVVEGGPGERVERYAHAALDRLGIASGARIVVDRVIPAHQGLGSGTQLAMAIGTALSRLYGADWSYRDMAQTMSRGARSGIGLALFEQGGFVVDGGLRSAGEPPAVISRLEFPAEWRLLMVLDPALRGLHGEQERRAFANLSVFPEADASRLCRLTLMQALPALTERDIAGFGAAISEIQRVVGDHFAPAQGGRFSSPAVADALQWLAAHGAAGIGQSSWGPTGFALLDSEFAARAMARLARQEFAGSSLEFAVCSGRNRGAEIHTESAGLRAHAH